MKTSTLIVPAALAAGVLIGGYFTAPAGAQAVGLASVPIVVRGPVQVEGVPTPQQMMRVKQGTPFTVPAGKLFVVTGVGAETMSQGADYIAIVIFDGLDAWATSIAANGAAIDGHVPAGLVAQQGQVVTTTLFASL